ncbi:Imm9 family immunity protein [Hymenobacter metallicola]|uniref:Uncharacterized protein n=1 Tax=Hymenobacter metallicola TaxID=2563114 RepID=A0A4Z0Q1Y5_9BACT|nr:Imm9 family immunity protein [Hymenobacter metallicola]TGE23526.1 hypothetical protein E5K02_20280 [Hymenobacter metallicola]
MICKISHTSYVIDFLDVDFNSSKISNLLELEFDSVLESMNIRDLSEWTIRFQIIYGRQTPIRVYKKMPSYKYEKEKLIIIHIPIPTKDIISWGVDPNQHIVMPENSGDDKSLIPIEIAFKDFGNREDYIISCLRKAIFFCLKGGFTVNGVKIKM